MTADMLLFRHAHDQSAGQRSYGWTGPWPPPERLIIVTGTSTGMDAVCDPVEQRLDAGHLAELTANGLTVEHFDRYSASAIPDSAPDDANWFRGAEYLPAERAT